MRKLRFVAVIALVTSAAPGDAQPGAPTPLALAATPATATFTYQGRLTVAGVPANAGYDFQFTLYDDAAAGSVIGSGTHTILGIAVANGLFTAVLDFGADAYRGDARFLQVAVRPAGVGGYQTLMPRQKVTAAPYASGLVVPFVATSNATTSTFTALNTSLVLGTGAAGVKGEGRIGVSGVSPIGGYWGVVGTYGAAPSGAIFQSGVYGTSSTANGVVGLSETGKAVWGKRTAATGTEPAIHGESNSTHDEAVGILGEINQFSPGSFAAGVKGVSIGTNELGIGVYGLTETGFGVYGRATAASGHAGYFSGPVHVAGALTKTSGTFKIDHPLDPANRYLSHSFVESPEMKNVYDGVATLDGAGCATVELPAYFEALNRDFRYQLTALGAPGPYLHVAREIEDGRFIVAGGDPGQRVSWQVTGIRKDAHALGNPVRVEEEKEPRDRGRYIDPIAHGQPPEKAIGQTRPQ
jgi:hypothetical protein